MVTNAGNRFLSTSSTIMEWRFYGKSEGSNGSRHSRLSKRKRSKRQVSTAQRSASKVRSKRGLPITGRMPRVVLVGATNAGKSTLFNKIIGRRQAVVHNSPGTTRDWQVAEAIWAGRQFALVDTGGLFGEEDESLRDKVFAAAEETLEGAHLVVLVVDAKVGRTGLDERISDFLRQGGYSTLLAVNKADRDPDGTATLDFASLGWDRVLPVSAIHGTGVGDLLDACVEGLSPKAWEEEEDEPFSVAIVGVPNAGKSSLMNALLGRERSIVYNKPGTTRDVLLDKFEWMGRRFVLADTAGVRRKSRVKNELEVFSVSRALGAAARCDVTVLVMDLTRGLTDQDVHLGNSCLDKGSGLVIFGNKVDLIEEEAAEEEVAEEELAEEEEEAVGMVREELLDIETVRSIISRPFKRVGDLPVIIGSATEKWGLKRLKSGILDVATRQHQRVRTSDFNDFLQEEVEGRGAFSGLSSPKILYGVQVDVSPPSFVVKVGHPERVSQRGLRSLMKQVVHRYEFHGCPVQIRFDSRRKTGGAHGGPRGS